MLMHKVWILLRSDVMLSVLSLYAIDAEVQMMKLLWGGDILSEEV